MRYAEMVQKHRKYWYTKKVLLSFGAIVLAVVVYGGTIYFLHSPLDSTVSKWLWRNGHFTAAYYLNYSDADLAMQEGNYFFGEGTYDLPKAIASYQQALTLHPGKLLGHYQLARIYYVQGDMGGASAEIQAELAANPSNFRSWYERGLIEITQGNLLAAEADFRHFIPWAPTEWGGYNDLSFVLAQEGKYAESAATIQKAFKLVPNGNTIPWLWNSLGLAQLNELEYTQAADSFKTAQVFAQRLTPQDWQRAYSANDPAAGVASIRAFQAAISANYQTAQARSAL
jgi:tetratricopeptide (TPR) repeat protein